MSDRSTKSPCTGVCKFSGAEPCRGCFRTREEVRGWKKMSDADKIRVNLRVRPLMTAGGKPSSKKVKKMDKKIRKLEKRLAKVRRKREALAAA